ncbi:Maltose/maltodextrin import ATP-binding protein MalK [Aquimixticola soesokkakensis]|uniref:Maltose/maltodextrin import ATP-binding protein MalK n=1 Tax=Aquimixticola soesokkakensis TaxID=1519096 RepID=A0A1Y5S0P1_9RHOB|nr:sn-glycerol-3-phosphate ABC transporter ATP-binding protein UgpC [Aquimixticola soesokkakensis]SLN27300.1 Maltose/maltodextrin import ATP-binding protein MalK [Aquimixticola soesokkakensis]
MSSVTIKNLQKSYGAVDVIHGIDVDIAPGEFVILVGPSGCGKSTMLRMVAGLEDISGGTISIGDRVVNDLAPKDRDIAMVFQNYALYPQMTVAQNMGFALEMAGHSKADIARQVARSAEILGLEPLLDRKPANLSGGQRQRVAMGRAIVREPQVFLFDEPLSNLDAKLRVQMRAEIKALHARLGTTILYVTHDQVEAMTMADKIVVLNAGKVEQIGSPLDLYDHPANKFVAGFLGSPAMNFFDATITQNTAQLADGQRVPLGARAGEVAEGQQLTLGLRPETLTLDPAGPLQGRVKLIEPTGSETFIALDIAGQDATVVLKDRLEAAAGDMLRFDVTQGRIHLFAAQSGLAL